VATNACQLGEPLDLGLRAAGSAWSPDSIHLAYTTAGSNAKVWRNEQLFMANVISGTITIVLDKGASYPTFSPDGQWVLMQAGYLGYYQGILAIAAIDGSHYRLISNSIRQWPARWWPDGDREFSTFAGVADIGPQVVMSVDGITTTVVIGHLKAGYSDGAWSKYRLVQFDQGEETPLPAGLHFIAWVDNESYLTLGLTQRGPAQTDGHSWPTWTPLLRVWLDRHSELLMTITGLASPLVYWREP
jgi:hypothetical protein